MKDVMQKMPSLILVTQNKHKLAELSPLFQEFNVGFSTGEVEKLEIRSDHIEEIAKIAAEHAYQVLGHPVVVDDTGLYITSLNGFPRSYPAFVLETIGREGILKLMQGVKDRTAEFATAVGYADGTVSKTFIGKMPGEISFEERGSGGFGYDPIFIPAGYTLTYSQMSFSEKTKISHRTKAFRKFLTWYTETQSR
jgi:XTP/dITP diphosphohydrolase